MAPRRSLSAVVNRHATRVGRLRRARDGSRAADRALCDEYRAVLRAYEDLVTYGARPAPPKAPLDRLRSLAKEGMLYLGGDADTWSRSLKDYDHELYGPYLGVSDEGSAAEVIRNAALSSPKARALRYPSPMALGIAHDAERLAAIGEVPVGPHEYADIRLACTGRILTSTNVGTRVNVRFYKRHPVVRVPMGATVEAVASAREQLKEVFAPFVSTPSGRPRPLLVFVEFDRQSRRDFASRAAILRALGAAVRKGDIADPAVHRIGFQMRIGFGAKGERAALLAVNLTKRAGMGDLSLDGVVRKEADELLSLPGLLNYLEPTRVQRVLDRAKQAGVVIHPKNTVDPDTVARHVWTSLFAARRMGLALGKYGTFPLSFEETSEVVRRVQPWFSNWSAAPVYFVDQGILTTDTVYVGARAKEGLKKWLRMVQRHAVPVVLVDTVDKSKGWRILKDEAHRAKGLLSAAEISALDRYAAGRGIKVLWAGGITLAQTYQFGAMGVFGIYVTSATASAAPVSEDYAADPLLSAMKEPTPEGVASAKLLLEAGFLAERLRDVDLRARIKRQAKAVIAALQLQGPVSDHTKLSQELAEQTELGWARFLRQTGHADLVARKRGPR